MTATIGQLNPSTASNSTPSVNIASIGGTPTAVKIGYNTANSNGTAILATVTAGKTAYVLGYTMSLCHGSTGAAQDANVILRVNGVTIDALHIPEAGTPITPVIGTKSVSLPLGYGISCAATQVIDIVVGGSSSTSNIADATIYYIEV